MSVLCSLTYYLSLWCFSLFQSLHFPLILMFLVSSPFPSQLLVCLVVVFFFFLLILLFTHFSSLKRLFLFKEGFPRSFSPRDTLLWWGGGGKAVRNKGAISDGEGGFHVTECIPLSYNNSSLSSLSFLGGCRVGYQWGPSPVSCLQCSHSCPASGWKTPWLTATGASCPHRESPVSACREQCLFQCRMYIFS